MTSVASPPRIGVSRVLIATQLAALVRQVVRHPSGTARVVVVQAQEAWTNGGDLTVDGVLWRVLRAPSPLALREALSQLEEAPAEERLVVLVPFDDAALGQDVRARIARQRVHAVRSLEMVQELFRAGSADRRVAEQPALVAALLENAPASGYPPVPGGTLDLDTAWMHLFRLVLELDESRPDPLAILRWSTAPGADARWVRLEPSLRDAVTARWRESLGPTSDALLGALECGPPSDLVPLGLVLPLLTGPGADGDANVIGARTRLAQRCAEVPYDAAVANRWSEAALRALADLDAIRPAAVPPLLVRAQSLVEQFRAEARLAESDLLPGAFAARMVGYVGTLDAWLAGQASADAVHSAAVKLLAHRESRGNPARTESIAMVRRAVRALAGAAAGAAGAEPASLGLQALRYAGGGAWIERVRTALLAGEADARLAARYAALAERIRVTRRPSQQRTAESLVAWNEQPLVQPGLMPVERLLDLVAAPVARERPILLLVLDGLDLAIASALREELRVQWTRWTAAPDGVPPVGVAVLPTVTEYSRVSLLSGRVTRGGQAEEKAGFRNHGGLTAACVVARPPVLLHKADLDGPAGGLSAGARELLADRQHKVVGAVVNAVDDWLDRSDQVRARWTLNDVPLLSALLQEAASAGRAVILASDHGHLLDHDTVLRPGDGAARWRAAAVAGEGEVVAHGPRVQAATGRDALVLAWDSSIRYAAKKTGYHGGAAPAEAFVPIMVLTRDEELDVAGWRVAVDVSPTWWDEVEGAGAAGAVAAGPSSSSTAIPQSLPAIALPPGSLWEAAAAQANDDPAWLGQLMASVSWAAQRQGVPRALEDGRVRTLLLVLHRSGGRAPARAVAAALGVPEVRLRGLIAKAAEMPPPEGYAVLGDDEATASVTLNIELLRRQFGLGG